MAGILVNADSFLLNFWSVYLVRHEFLDNVMSVDDSGVRFATKRSLYHEKDAQKVSLNFNLNLPEML